MLPLRDWGELGGPIPTFFMRMMMMMMIIFYNGNMPASHAMMMMSLPLRDWEEVGLIPTASEEELLHILRKETGVIN